MTSALEALSGVSVASASSDRLDLELTTDVAHNHLLESGWSLGMRVFCMSNALVQCMHSVQAYFLIAHVSRPFY